MTNSPQPPLSLPQAATRFPNRPSSQTVYRWATHGVRGVKLGSQMIGGRKYTSQAAIDRFLVDLNQTPADRAAAELIADGC